MKTRIWEISGSHPSIRQLHVLFHLTTVSGQTTSFYYDPDGNLLSKVKPDGSATLYLGGLYEVDLTSVGVTTKKTTYYPGGAMRVDIVGGSNTLYYSLRDHLGSASVLLDSTGNLVTNGEQRYYPFGESRLTSADLKTDHLFTGQLSVGLGGIYHYGARMYSPRLGRFLSADTIVPNWADPQSLNRFSYVLNQPLRYVDPTGHFATAIIGGAIGAIVGAVGYTAYTAYTGQAFDYGEYLAAIGTTALAGAYIGSGIGIIHAAAQAATLTVATLATANVPISIGVGIASAEVGYTIETARSGDDFSANDLYVSAGFGAASGGIDAAFPGSSNLGKRLLLQTTLGTGQYAATNGLDAGMAEAAIASFTVAGAGEVMGIIGGGSILDDFSARGSQTMANFLEPIVVGEQVGNAFTNVGRSAYLVVSL